MLTVGSCFSGIGLLDYGLHLAGLEHAWLCEVDPWRRGILEARWPGACVYEDVRAVGDGCPRVDVIAGGFPCKGASTAGKREGFGHPETVLWREMARAVRELRPRYVLVENVAAILGLHAGAVWGEVVGDLAACGYDIEWDCFPAAAFGAPHLRDRVVAVATHTQGEDGQGARPGRPALGRAQANGGVAAADPESGRHAPVVSAGERGGREAAGAPQRQPTAATNAGGERRQQESRSAHGDEGPDEGRSTADDHQPSGAGEAVGVEWGKFEPAVRRWEAIIGTAPKPLIRGVDARGTARVVRSRNSALGDGVQVQLGQLAGERIVSLEANRVTT